MLLRCPISLYLTLVTCSIVPEPQEARIFVDPPCTRRTDGRVLWLTTKKNKILPLKVDFLQQFLVLLTSFVQIIKFSMISVNSGSCNRPTFPLSKIHICDTDWQTTTAYRRSRVSMKPKCTTEFRPGYCTLLHLWSNLTEANTAPRVC